MTQYDLLVDHVFCRQKVFIKAYRLYYSSTWVSQVVNHFTLDKTKNQLLSSRYT